LDLQLFCVNWRLAESLDIWPELPIVIHIENEGFSPLQIVMGVISLLKQHDRVYKIYIQGVPNFLLEELAATSEPFPALVELNLISFEDDAPTLPDSFLGGSVPCLRLLRLSGVPFPAIGKLLLSTRDLITLSLDSTPSSRYISPASMDAILSVLTKLKLLHLNFETPQHWTHGASRRTPEFTRIVLPALTNFYFNGNCMYLEDIASRIDAPLDFFAVTFSSQPVVSDIPMLRDFIGRTKIPNAPHQANIYFSSIDATISLFQRNGDVDSKVLSLKFPFSSDRLAGLSLLAQACNSLLPPLPCLEHLGIHKSGPQPWPSRWQNEVQTTQWMELLRPFSTVKDLVLDKPVALFVASALQEFIGQRVTEILPALQNIFLDGIQSCDPVPEDIAKFIAARQLSGHSVILHHRGSKQHRHYRPREAGDR
jgi:hypothetical protein